LDGIRSSSGVICLKPTASPLSSSCRSVTSSRTRCTGSRTCDIDALRARGALGHGIEHLAKSVREGYVYTGQSLFMGEEYGELAPFPYFVSHTDEKPVEAVRKGRKAEFAEFGRNLQNIGLAPRSAVVLVEAGLQ
jgi:hypothetical protein